MSRLLLIIILFAFVGTINNAQMRMSPTERAKQLSEQLKLNPKQTKQVEEIFTKSQDQMMKLFEGGDMRSEDNRAKIQKMREESNASIMKILTPKQKDEYKKVLEEQRKRMEERRQNRGNQ